MFGACSLCELYPTVDELTMTFQISSHFGSEKEVPLMGQMSVWRHFMTEDEEELSAWRELSFETTAEYDQLNHVYVTKPIYLKPYDNLKYLSVILLDDSGYNSGKICVKEFDSELKEIRRQQ